jgi:hypothetical protein
VSPDDLVNAVQVLVRFERRDRAEAVAETLPEDLPVAELLRASDGAQQLARALSARRRSASADSVHDPHDVGSLYS